MTLEEYAAVAAACDRLLRAPGAGLERLAVPLLHVIKEHPGWLRQYEPKPQAASGRVAAARQALAARVRAAAGIILRSMRQTFTAAPARHLRAPVQVLIVSHLTSPAQLDTDADSYFGSLQGMLNARGINSVLVLVDHLRDRTARRACRIHPRLGQRVLLPRSVPLATELGIWWRCIQARRTLRREARAATESLPRSLALLAARDVVCAQTLANLRLHKAVARLCARLRPAIVITTHEGDACERVIWHAARSQPRPPLCVGYQHALLLQHAHAIRRRIGAGQGTADPDVILTLGETSHALLAASPDLGAVRLIRYGSHRRARNPQFSPWQERALQCLVLPDAEESECVVLFHFALACALLRPDLTFVLRPHPIVDFPLLATRHPNLRQLPPNVRLSSQALARDCSQSRYCLYRGSSAAIHAVLSGVKPFYLARRDEITFDPLFTLGEWRETVSAPGEFVRRALHADAAPDERAAQLAWEECNRYIWDTRSDALDELVALAADRRSCAGDDRGGVK